MRTFTNLKLKDDVSKLQSLLNDQKCLYKDAKRGIEAVTLKLNKALEELSIAKLSVDKLKGLISAAKDLVNSI